MGPETTRTKPRLVPWQSTLLGLVLLAVGWYAYYRFDGPVRMLGSLAGFIALFFGLVGLAKQLLPRDR